MEKISAENLGSADEEFATKPPSHISEAGILSIMENSGHYVDDADLANALMGAEGLGTATTRADIIENIKNREYVDSRLRPTPKGIRLIDVLNRINARQITLVDLTEELELHLNEVESGGQSPEGFMSEIAVYAEEVVRSTREFDWDEI